MVYKAVAIARHSGTFEPVVPVYKESEGKATRGGVVRPYRVVRDGEANSETLVEQDRPGPTNSRPLHVPLLRSGHNAYPYTLAQDRVFHQRVRAELPESMRRLDGAPAFEAEVVAESSVD